MTKLASLLMHHSRAFCVHALSRLLSTLVTFLSFSINPLFFCFGSPIYISHTCATCKTYISSLTGHTRRKNTYYSFSFLLIIVQSLPRHQFPHPTLLLFLGSSRLEIQSSTPETTTSTKTAALKQISPLMARPSSTTLPAGSLTAGQLPTSFVRAAYLYLVLELIFCFL